MVCLCAAWCRTCDAYRTVFDTLAAQHPHWRFVWLDVEDEAALLGDEIDIETFPTLLIADAEGVRFWGALPPHSGVLERMLAHPPAGCVPDPEAQALWQRIRAAQPLA